ncbi:MATE family efflux transporter [Rhodoferax sp.]|uniref:MATE family efflux transporter n=1 Tax=Rhodoferax sp. TaxID=50421 RepID=UPI00271E37D0|nr:MATE family efflux transporter [Rhodoferax sp.]MDO9197326.1 MATE family efflux transporter [Rhodoferax sp.]
MSELKIISRHAATVLVGQLAVMAFGVTDTIVAGRYSESSLAALSVGSAVYISVFVALMGVLQALLPVWAELQGAKRHRQLGRSFRQALYLCGITMLVGMAVLLSPGALLNLTEVPMTLRSEVQSYLAVLALALPPSLLFRMYSTLNQGLGRPQLVTWLQIGSLFIKVPLSIWFAFGGLGLEPQGAVGCAWATLVVNYAMLGVALWLVRTQDLYQPYGIWGALERPNWKEIATFARLGIPGGLAIMVEVTSFTLMALFIARMGTVAAASHQIAANVAAVLYMVPLSIAIAASSRVSYWLGAGNKDKASAVIRTGLTMTVSAALLLSLALLLARTTLATIYARSPDVVALAVPLLGWVAIYHLADAVQAVCVFLLRCFGVTIAPLAVYCLLLWGMGLAGGYLLAYQGLGTWQAMHTPSAFWATSAAALGMTAFIFTFILWLATRRRR